MYRAGGDAPEVKGDVDELSESFGSMKGKCTTFDLC